MKKIYYYILFCAILSCSKDETKTRRIQLSYAETQINTTFRAAGSMAPDIIVWNGEPGTYSISSSTEILQRRRHMSFDTLTGVLSWGKDFPLGIYDFTITAQSGETTTAVEILLTNTLTKAFFSGGFLQVDDPDDINFSADIPIDYGLWLNEDGSISMERYGDRTFLASGNWMATEGGTISVEFLTNPSGGATTYMSGFLSNSLVVSPKFQGEYGPAVDENQEIENLTGIFRFEWD